MYDYKFTGFNRCTAGDGNKEKTKPISVGVWPKVQETQEKERNIAVGKQGQSRWRYKQTKIKFLYVSIKKDRPTCTCTYNLCLEKIKLLAIFIPLFQK